MDQLEKPDDDLYKDSGQRHLDLLIKLVENWLKLANYFTGNTFYLFIHYSMYLLRGLQCSFCSVSVIECPE